MFRQAGIAILSGYCGNDRRLMLCSGKAAIYVQRGAGDEAGRV